MIKLKAAALAAAVALASAGSASATVYVGWADGVFTSGVPQNAQWIGPAIQAGDALHIDFTFDDSRCDMVGDNCYGGDGDAGPLHQLPASATIAVDGWAHTIAGKDLQIDSLSGLHMEDYDLTLVFSELMGGGPAGGGHLTWDMGTPFQMNFGLTAYDPEPIGGIPEPEAWALMMAGASATGLALRWQRRAALSA
jgi:hypothetical protein